MRRIFKVLYWSKNIKVKKVYSNSSMYTMICNLKHYKNKKQYIFRETK